MNKPIELSDCIVGDELWSPVHGEVDVLKITEDKAYPVLVQEPNGTTRYDFQGRFVSSDLHPTLFHSFSEFMEYWNMEKKKTVDEHIDEILEEVGIKKENEGG